MSSINLIETDANAIYENVISGLEEAVGEPLYPGDERRIFGEALVALVVGIFNQVNDACRQKMLEYARDDVLDALGARTDTARIAPTKAQTILRFETASAISSNIIIAEGTRVTPDNNIYFATTEAAVITAGKTFVEVTAEAEEAGSSGNGYGVQTISQLVDLIPYVDNVYNTTVTYGGDDGEPYDDDGNDKYRERIRLSVSKMTTAGPSESYRYYALSADAAISDVSISSPTPGTVLIVPICKGGVIPDETILHKVAAICSADDVRPMTDLVEVQAPEQVEYTIDIKYYTTEDQESDCVSTIEGSGGSIEIYQEWQDTVMGRAINPDYLRKLILAPTEGVGATRVEVTSPAYTVLSQTQVAKCKGITVTHAVE